MTRKRWDQKSARLLQKEFLGVSTYQTILELVRKIGEDGARSQLKEWADRGDSELREKGLKQ
jgi:hypothetical protein